MSPELLSISKKPASKVFTFIVALESLELEEIQEYWGMKYISFRRQLMNILGAEISNYPKCQSVFVYSEEDLAYLLSKEGAQE